MMRVGLIALSMSACFDVPPRPAALDAREVIDSDIALEPASHIVVVGRGHVCATADEGVQCWGDGSLGRLGDLSATPGIVAPGGVARPVADLGDLVLGGAHGCGMDGGDVYCWGDNQRAQVGGDEALVWRARRVASGAIAVAVGRATTCVRLEDDVVRCWGEPLDEATAPDNVTGKPGPTWGEPVAIRGLPRATEIALGRGFGCGLVDVVNGNEVRCFGSNQRGELGRSEGVLASSIAAPTSALGFEREDVVAAIAAGDAFACARSRRGQVACWGDNRESQAGDASGVSSALPHVLSLPDGVVVRSLALGACHGCALATSGDVLCWGDNGRGQLGHDDPATAVPRRAKLDERALAIAAGGDTTCAATASAVRCWGDGQSGQLAQDFGTTDPTLMFSTTPIAVPLSRSPSLGCEAPCRPIEQLVAGGDETCVGTSDGAWCWGGSSASPRMPSVISISPDGLARGDGATCSLSRGGVVVCVGDLLAPTQPALALAMSGARACIIEMDGAVSCWTAQSVPARVPGVVADSAHPRIAIGVDAACVAVVRGVVCWGDNARGQLGQGTWHADALSPVIGVAEPDVLVGAGGRFCALTRGEPLRCWGANDRGTLGGGDDVATPTSIAPWLAVHAVALGPTTTCVIAQADAAAPAEVFCWGDNRGLALGLGPELITSSEPHRVRLAFAPDAVAVGRAHACAAGNGHIACWGEDGQGQLGRAQVGEPRASPVAVTLP